jgi:hypothetical protein
MMIYNIYFWYLWLMGTIPASPVPAVAYSAINRRHRGMEG